jgi:hypothetical protein
VLHVVGPLRLSGESEAETDGAIETEVNRVAELLEFLRTKQRLEIVGEHGTYERSQGALEPPPRPQQQGQAAQSQEGAQ